MNYKPHIDGLRAIAILFVLIFHAGLTVFPSGFIGVDVFFVISGFLITGMIHGSLENNQFSFIEFYKRRLWRLQPVFICLLLVTTLITFLFYLPEDLITFGSSARKSALFISNHFFERVTQGYFSENANYLPLLHTWSLSIEWQCYLILPFAFYLLHRVFGNKHIGKLIFLLTLALFLLSLHNSQVDPDKTYYHFLSRVFEFLMGSCVALLPRGYSFNSFLVNLLSLAAFFVLFYIARLSGINSGFPNVYAFILCFATALLIATGENKKKPLIIKIISLKPIVFIGLLSYSLYIWHWPVFVLIRYLDYKETTLVLGIAFSLIGIISYLSWRFIEKPGRKLAPTSFTYTFAFLFILPFFLLHFNVYGIKKFEGYPQRFAETPRIYKMLKKYSSKLRPYCLHAIEKGNIKVASNCLLGAKDTPEGRKGFMIGDSFSNHHWQFMDALSRDAHLTILAHSTAGCLSLPGLLQIGWIKDMAGVYEACRDQNALYYQMIKKNHYDFVIIGQNWSGYLSDRVVNRTEDPRSLDLSKERIAHAMEEAIKIIKASGARPVLIKSVALPQGNPYDCFFRHIKRRAKYQPEQCDYRFDPEKDLWFEELFAKMQKKYSSLILIDPKKVQCSKGLCKADINGIPVFRDITHITDYASYRMANSYLKRYKNPLAVL